MDSVAEANEIVDQRGKRRCVEVGKYVGHGGVSEEEIAGEPDGGVDGGAEEERESDCSGHVR